MTFITLKHDSPAVSVILLWNVREGTADHLCQNATKTPNINRLVVIVVKKDNFWRSVPSGAYRLC